MDKEFNEIGIIAVDSHFELVSNLLELLSESPLTMHVLVSDSYHETKYQNSNIRFVKTIDGDRKSILDFLSNIKKQTHILVLTLYKDYQFFHRLSRSYSLSFIVHNSHFTFADSRYAERPGTPFIKYLANNFRNILFRESFYKKKLLDSSTFVYFLSLTTLEYASVNYAKWNTKFRLLPYIFANQKRHTNSREYTIAIPGGANAMNRDYTYLKSWLSSIVISTPIKIVFLGRSTTRQCQRLISEFTTAYRDKFKIVTFDKYLDQKTYDQWISESVLLLSLLKKEVSFRGYIELYGKTKITGSINDAIKNQVPLLLPAFYPVDNNCRSLVYQYRDLESFLRVMNSFYINRDNASVEIASFDISLVREQLYNNLKLGKP